MVDAKKFRSELGRLKDVLDSAMTVLITAPGAADGDSIGAQLALRRMLLHSYPSLKVFIVNDEELPPRYRFLPDVEWVDTPETYRSKKIDTEFDVAFICDGGIDRAGRVRSMFERSRVTVTIDHHVVAAEYPYSIRLVETSASSTTELIYRLAQESPLKTPLDPSFAQQIYLGLIFDTGFFRHSNTTPEVMELGAQLLRTGFDFTRVGERGMLERTKAGLQVLADTLSRVGFELDGKIVWSSLTQETMRRLNATDDDREGIIDHLFLTQGIEVALLFIELSNGATKVSFRSQGDVDVATFARSLTVRGGGHAKAAGANLDMGLPAAIELVLSRLKEGVTNQLDRASVR